MRMPKKASIAAAPPPPPPPPAPKFKLSKALRARLPKLEQADAEKLLWDKSAGLCALCGTPLGKDIDPDHIEPLALGGKDELANLYLAHKSCNASRQTLPFDLAKAVVGFKVFAEQNATITFDDVLKRYVPLANRDVEVSFDANRVTLRFGGSIWEAPVSEDPATGVRYFFAEVPTTHILNDKEIQPRLIMHGHVRKLALDFTERPVHEPSNCRLVPTGLKTAEFLQFDGQHKTTAQILLGRSQVPVKVYVEPSIAMLQELVLKIQQEIKKQPLTKSDTVAKLGDVMRAVLEDYKPKEGQYRSEKGLVESQPTKEYQRTVKDYYFGDLERLVFFSEENELAAAVRPGDLQHAPITTDKVAIERIIRPLISSSLLEDDMDSSNARDLERDAILLVLNSIARKMLPVGWRSSELQRLRAGNFFKQASIGWWMEILIDGMRLGLMRLKKPLFQEPLSSEEETKIIALCEAICDWPVWSTTDPDDLKALRSNTVKNVKDRPPFKKYDEKRLVKEALM